MFDQPELSPRCPAESEDPARSVLGRSEEDMAELRELGVTAVRLEGLIDFIVFSLQLLFE